MYKWAWKQSRQPNSIIQKTRGDETARHFSSPNCARDNIHNVGRQWDKNYPTPATIRSDFCVWFSGWEWSIFWIFFWWKVVITWSARFIVRWIDINWILEISKNSNYVILFFTGLKTYSMYTWILCKFRDNYHDAFTKAYHLFFVWLYSNFKILLF